MCVHILLSRRMHYTTCGNDMREGPHLLEAPPAWALTAETAESTPEAMSTSWDNANRRNTIDGNGGCPTVRGPCAENLHSRLGLAVPKPSPAGLAQRKYPRIEGVKFLGPGSLQCYTVLPRAQPDRVLIRLRARAACSAVLCCLGPGAT